MVRIHLVMYAPSSPQRLVDMAKLAFGLEMVDAFVIVKPTGMAAQVGVPDVSKLAYKLGKKLLILPQLTDLTEVLNVDKVLFVVRDPNAASIYDVEIGDDSIAIVVQGGEQSFTKQDLSLGIPIKIPFLENTSPLPLADATLALFIIAQRIGNRNQ